MTPTQSNNQFIEERIKEFDKTFFISGKNALGYDVPMLFPAKEEVSDFLRQSLLLQHEHDKKVMIEEIEKLRLPYSYKRKSSFPGESVDYHLKTYGHLPEKGCCQFDQLTDQEADVYNKCVDKTIEIIKGK